MGHTASISSSRGALDSESAFTRLLSEINREHRRTMLMAVLFGFLLGAVGFAVLDESAGRQASHYLDILSPRPVSPTGTANPQVMEFPRRELPAEWRWEPRQVPYEHMYNRKPPGKPDWIRQGG